MVSTDSKEIAKCVVNSGVKLPFYRSKETSSDYATIDQVIQEILNYYSKVGKEFQNICCIFPANPLIDEKKIRLGYDKLNENSFDCVFSGVKYSYPVQRSFKIDKSEKVIFNFPENYTKRTQDLESYYHDAGQFYWFRKESFKKFNKGGQIILVLKLTS